VQEFGLRLKRNEQIGLLTCSTQHHSLLLDSRDYWADVLQDGRPPLSRCSCGSILFRVRLEYELRSTGDVRNVSVMPTCARCGKAQRPMIVDIRYSPTEQLIEKPLDAIERPWLQPKRREITALWLPSDAEKFARHLAEPSTTRTFVRSPGHKYVECRFEEVQFYPELKRDLLFTNLPEIAAPSRRDPHRDGPFLRLSGPTHMGYSPSLQNHHLLHYVQYSKEVIVDGRPEAQPRSFLEFAEKACDWLVENYVSQRGKNTADNLQEYLRAKPHLDRIGSS
jgi:hypothetical protein